MVPDRKIVNLVRAYDPNLLIRWNATKNWFELWMKRPLCSEQVLITPITKSIYEEHAPREFVALDERLLWWVYWADSHQFGGAKNHAFESDKRWVEFQQKLDTQKFQNFKDIGKDIWSAANAFYGTKHGSKNHGATWNKSAKKTPWKRPDIQKRTSSRIFARSRQNAVKYGYRG